jgi:hypothetical protein
MSWCVQILCAKVHQTTGSPSDGVVIIIQTQANIDNSMNNFDIQNGEYLAIRMGHSTIISQVQYHGELKLMKLINECIVALKVVCILYSSIAIFEPE